MEINQNSKSLLSLMGSSPMGGATLPMGPMNAGADSGKGSFVDLLDVAADLEIAENQSLNAGADLEDALKFGVVDDGKKDIAKQENQSAISGLSLGLLSGLQQMQDGSVGQIQFVQNENRSAQAGNGIDNSKALLLKGAALDLLGQGQLAQAQSAKAAELNSEALAQWSAAIAANDLKSVRLEESMDAVAGKELSNAAAQEKGIAGQLLKNISSVDAQTGGAGAFSSSARNGESSNDSSSADGKREKLGSLQAKELLLDRGTAHSFASGVAALAAPVVAKSSANALVNASSLGEAGDSRISHQSLDFVAEKIEQLKSHGGGSIRIELAPKEMGAIDVKVGMRGGVLQVQIKAENMVTQQALQASKADLQSKLAKVAPSEINVSALRDMNKEVVQLSQHKSLTQNSEHFLSSLNGSDLRAASSLVMEQKLQTSSSGSSSSQFGSGQGGSSASDDFLSQRQSMMSWDKQESFRDDKRDQARDQWEQLSRKSA